MTARSAQTAGGDMLAEEPQSLPEAAFGRVLQARVKGCLMDLHWQLDRPVTALALGIWRLNRAPDLHALPGQPGPRARGVAFDATPDVTDAAILAKSDGRWWRLPEKGPEPVLGRLLSRDLTAVNANLRWAGRISDLDTRFFAALNSIAQAPRDFALQARCLVSVGYEAIERADPEKTGWARGFCQAKKARLLAEKDAEVRVSVLLFWLHLAIFQEDLGTFLEITEMVLARDMAFFAGLEAYPVGTANALYAQVMLGGFFLACDEPERAGRLFSPFDKHFRIAAQSYPRTLNGYHEIVQLTRRAYLCRIGQEQARGRPVSAKGVPPLSAGRAWDESNRLRIKATEVQEAMRARFLRLVAARRRSGAEGQPEG